jgi:hypothetical protein
MLQNHLQKVINNWRKEDLKLEESISRAELNAAFTKIGILPAKEIFDIYSVFNGFAEEELDSECMTFWTIKKMMAEYQKESQYVVFVDYLLYSHRYAFKSNDENTASVYLYYGDEDTTKVSNSFAEFFESYLMDISKLFI